MFNSKTATKEEIEQLKQEFAKTDIPQWMMERGFSAQQIREMMRLRLSDFPNLRHSLNEV